MSSGVVVVVEDPDYAKAGAMAMLPELRKYNQTCSKNGTNSAKTTEDFCVSLEHRADDRMTMTLTFSQCAKTGTCWQIYLEWLYKSMNRISLSLAKHSSDRDLR